MRDIVKKLEKNPTDFHTFKFLKKANVFCLVMKPEIWAVVHPKPAFSNFHECPLSSIGDILLTDKQTQV